MQLLEVPIATILPIEHGGIWRGGVNMYLRDAARGEEWPPIDVVAYPDMPEHHILLHGHHRGRAAYELGRMTIAANLTDSDADISTDAWAELRLFYPGIRSIEALVSKYRDTFLPRVRAAGFSGLHDIPVAARPDLL